MTNDILSFFLGLVFAFHFCGAQQKTSTVYRDYFE